MKPATVLIVACLMATVAAPAFAQRGGGGRRGGGGGVSSSSSLEFAPLPPSTPASQVEMIGVVEEVDLKAERVTIAYEASPQLNLQAWTVPFPVAKPDLLTGVTIGQKVRFKVDGHQIYTLQPF